MTKIVFYGTGEFAATVLKAIANDASYKILAVITSPDQPIGRKQEMQKSAVKTFAETLGVEILQPASLKEFDAPILSEADLGVVAEYGFIIPQRLLDLPKHKTVNLHGSILPKLRGASPIQTAIMNGETETGVTLMLMDAKMDHGPIIAMQKLSILPDETQKELFTRLAIVASELFLRETPKYISGEIIPVEQNHDGATFCKIFTRDDGHVDFSQPAQNIYNQYRAMTPWPGLWTTFEGKRLKLSVITPADPKNLSEGQILAQNGHLYVGCGANSAIEAIEVQPEGKKPMDAKSFINGARNLTRFE
ncbi:MAG: methionyl-tRNA formyltransferase [Patescibacteria group bacterium]